MKKYITLSLCILILSAWLFYTKSTVSFMLNTYGDMAYGRLLQVDNSKYIPVSNSWVIIEQSERRYVLKFKEANFLVLVEFFDLNNSNNVENRIITTIRKGFTKSDSDWYSLLSSNAASDYIKISKYIIAGVQINKFIHNNGSQLMSEQDYSIDYSIDDFIYLRISSVHGTSQKSKLNQSVIEEEIDLLAIYFAEVLGTVRLPNP